ncbi:MAG: hypothetical protein H6717_34620 [Polyangiaceae bacterium]|nr:hypothetical protein [Polyangiaceae bacterium]
MKPIELLVRSDAWDKKTQKLFRDHLAKNMSDTARLSYTARKAWFMGRSGNKTKLRQAEALVSWGLARFTRADREALANARSTRSGIREELGRFEDAAADVLAAGRHNPTIAATAIYAARALLRAHSLRATRDVLKLERRVLRDPTAKLMQEYSVWKWIVAAACAKSRKDHALAAQRARRALDSLARVPGLQAQASKKMRTSFAAVDITRAELDTVRRWASDT